MDRRSEVKRIWQERFNDSKLWMSEVFSRIYNEQDAMTLDVDGVVVSSLLLRRYSLRLSDINLPMGYIYGAATRRDSQGKGYMSQLLKDALVAAHQRGDVLVSLIPARRRLFDFYEKFGFKTLFYIDEQRFTSRHIFATDSSEYEVDDTAVAADELSSAYERLSASRQATVLHDPDDFMTILIDNSVSAARKAIIRSRLTGEIVAIAFATLRDKVLTINDVVADSDEAWDMAIGTIRSSCGDVAVVVNMPVGRGGVTDRPKAMARLVDVKGLLERVAARHRDFALRVRVADPIVEANNHTFIVSDGSVKVTDDFSGRIDLDVSVTTLTSILLSAPKVGDIFGIPSARPFLSLMLD